MSLSIPPLRKLTISGIITIPLQQTWLIKLINTEVAGQSAYLTYSNDGNVLQVKNENTPAGWDFTGNNEGSLLSTALVANSGETLTTGGSSVAIAYWILELDFNGFSLPIPKLRVSYIENDVIDSIVVPSGQTWVCKFIIFSLAAGVGSGTIFNTDLLIGGSTFKLIQTNTQGVSGIASGAINQSTIVMNSGDRVQSYVNTVLNNSWKVEVFYWILEQDF